MCEVHQHKILESDYNGEMVFARFNIKTSDWNDINMFAVFDKTITVAINDDFMCRVPQDIIDCGEEFRIGLYGIYEDMIINTNCVTVKPFKKNYDEKELFNPYFLQKALKNKI